MSTRSVIARAQGDAFVGIYHHFDGYPKGVGATLYRIYHTVFHRDLARMLHILIDEHPAGWSTIITDNWQFDKEGDLICGYIDVGNPDRDLPFRQQRPQCYCHGDRHEEEDGTVRSTDTHTWCAYAYIFDEQHHIMTVSRPIYSSSFDVQDWRPIHIVNLRSDEIPPFCLPNYVQPE